MFYKIHEVAKLFGVTNQTITNWCNHGKLKCMRTLSNYRIFDKDYIDTLVEDMKNV